LLANYRHKYLRTASQQVKHKPQVMHIIQPIMSKCGREWHWLFTCNSIMP